MVGTREIPTVFSQVKLKRLSKKCLHGDRIVLEVLFINKLETDLKGVKYICSKCNPMSNWSLT